MGLIENYEKIQAGRMLKEWASTFDSELVVAEKMVDGKKAVAPIITHCETLLTKMTNLKTVYPENVAEVDSLLIGRQKDLSNFKTLHEI